MQWIVRKADGVFLRGGAVEVYVEDPNTEELVEIIGDVPVDPARERWLDGVRVFATDEQLQAMNAAEKDAEIDSFAALKAVAQALWEQIPAHPGKLTAVQTIDRIKVIYRNQS